MTSHDPLARAAAIWTLPRLESMRAIADLLEATAAAEQRLRERIEAVPLYDETDRIVTMSGGLREVRTPADAAEAIKTRILALLDTPPPASPRQGEPVDVERLARALRSENAADWFALIEGEKWPDGQRLSEGFAGDFARALAAEYAALSEPTEAGT